MEKSHPRNFHDAAEAIGLLIPQIFDGVVHVHIMKIPNQPGQFIVGMDLENGKTVHAIWNATTSSFVQSSV